jgi:hypothetical protein
MRKSERILQAFLKSRRSGGGGCGGRKVLAIKAIVGRIIRKTTGQIEMI